METGSHPSCGGGGVGALGLWLTEPPTLLFFLCFTNIDFLLGTGGPFVFIGC